MRRVDGDYRPRSAKPPRISCEEAMNALLKATDKTQEFLSQFKDDFDQDIRSVESYASPEMINELWCSKVEVGDGHHHSARSRSQDQVPLNFRDVVRGLYKSLKSAISSTNPKLDHAVARKLHHANDDMWQLLQDVAVDSKLMNELMTELEMLTVFLERNGARAGSRSDNRNTSERQQKRASKRGESRERQQSRRGSDGYQHSDDGRGESGSEGRGSVDGSEADDRDRDQEGQPDTEHQDDE